MKTKSFKVLAGIVIFLISGVLPWHSIAGRESLPIMESCHPLNSRNNSFHLYLSVSDRHTILHYTGDDENGSLMLTDSVPTAGTCGSLTVSPDKRFLYAAERSEKGIAIFRINETTGALNYISSVRAAGNPVYLSIDNSGRFLFSAYYSDNVIAVHRILDNGELTTVPIQVIKTPDKPHFIRIDRSNRFVFVPVLGADTVRQYLFNPETGKLSPNDPSGFAAADGSGPRHLTFHPSLPYCFGVNELNSTVTAYSLNEKTGVLKEIQTISNVPPGHNANNTCADVHISPDGKILFTSNRGHNSIATYRVDNRTGKLTLVGYFATEKTPREFDITSSGRFLYAAGQDSGGLASYRIEANGELTPLTVYHPGGKPEWVEIIELGE